MGLLSLIESRIAPRGLLQKATFFLSHSKNENLEEDFDEIFFSWVKKRKFEKCAVLSENYGYFCMSDFYGFSAQTALKSISSADFWMGTLKNTGEWEFFCENDGSLAPFFQLFSESDHENIKRLCILPKNISGRGALILIASNDENSNLTLPSPSNENLISIVKNCVSEFRVPHPDREQIQKNLAQGFLRYDSSCFILSLKLAVKKLFSQVQILNADIKKIIENAIHSSALNEIKTIFAPPVCVTRGIENEIKILIFSNEKIESELLQIQLERPLQKILGKNLEGIVLLPCGFSTNAQEAEHFLF